MRFRTIGHVNNYNGGDGMSFISNLYRKKDLKSINKKLIGIYLLNVSDIIFTLFLLNTGLFIEINSIMSYVINNNNVLSILIKVIVPLILLVVIALRIEDATEKQLHRSNIIITSMLLVYALIDVSHILWTTMYIIA